MYVYLHTEHGYHKGEPYNLWTVGHYAPDGRFVPESDCETAEKAASRCHYLNGGDLYN